MPWDGSCRYSNLAGRSSTSDPSGTVIRGSSALRCRPRAGGRIMEILPPARWGKRRRTCAGTAPPLERCAVRRGMVLLDSTETFPFRYHFRDLAALEAFIKTRWTATILPARVRRRLSALQRRAHGGEIIVVEPVRLTVLRKA